MASITESHDLPTMAPIWFHRFNPSLPVKLSAPPDSVPSTGLPLMSLLMGASSQTAPMDATIASVARKVSTASSVGLSATSSGTPIRS